MKNIFLLALLTLTLLAASARSEQFPVAGLLTPEMIQKIKPELELTPDQEAKIAAVLREAREKGASVESSLREEQKALQQMLRDPSGTADAASDLLTKILALEGDLKHPQLRTLFTMREMLTPDQRQKALQLAISTPLAGQSEIEGRVRAKVARLQAAVQSLGEKPTEGMRRRGEPIRAMIQEGNWQAADTALDAAIADAGLDALDEPVSTPDFSSYDPGDTTSDALKARLDSVKDRARDIVSLPTIRRLLKARDALEDAKAAQDALAAGRILTFAEQELAGK